MCGSQSLRARRATAAGSPVDRLTVCLFACVVLVPVVAMAFAAPETAICLGLFLLAMFGSGLILTLLDGPRRPAGRGPAGSSRSRLLRGIALAAGAAMVLFALIVALGLVCSGAMLVTTD
jgi:hypothetical protein